MFTVGIATYDDYSGLYFTIQSLRLYHQLVNEIIIIDNNPNSEDGNLNKLFSTYGSDNFKIKYVKYEDKKTSFCKEQVFKYASNEYVVVCDSHILFYPKAFNKLQKFYNKHHKKYDFIQGPLIYDNNLKISTHLKPEWGSHFYGVWDTKITNDEWFEIPAQGMGVFSCKKNEWLGFNKLFTGFGGEEYYIHEKYKQAGGRCICVNGFRWMHRFNKPDKATFPNNLEDRFRNYIIGRIELNQKYDDVIYAFSEQLHAFTMHKIIQDVKTCIA
jgi:hypothetical protein